MRSLVALLLAVLAAPVARAETYVLRVAARDTPAGVAAEKLADGATNFWFPKLPKAVAKASELLQQQEHTVRILVAGAREAELSPAGTYSFAGVASPKGTLELLGGWSPDFQTRAPFKYPTQIIADAGRPEGFFNFDRKSAFASLVISGFVFDAAPSNKYDAKTNSLLKGSSRTIPLLSLRQVNSDRVVIADNVFLNGAQRAFEAYVTPVTNDAVIEIRNNFFLNNVSPLKLEPARAKAKVKTILVSHNSFLLNWPFNPDPTSSNVGAIELWNAEAVAEVKVEGNLFAYNPGGAMQHDWPTGRMPKLAITDNLFFLNATLFGNAEPDAGLFTGKFGPGPMHKVVKLRGAEDDFDYTLKGNVSLDPKVPVALVDLGAADSSGVTAKKTILNDLRGLFGLNKDGGTVAIRNYAPRMGLDLDALPFPAEPAAKAYGVSADAVYK